jgi:cyclohexanone monooxygenase
MRARARQTKPGIYGRFNPGSALDVSEEERLQEYERRWQEGGLLFMQSYGDLLLDKKANDTLVAFVHGKIRSLVNDPEIADLLCPDNIIGGKRLCVDTNYYATYNRDNVRLVDLRKQPIRAINRTGLLVGDTQYDVDIIVIATGFDAMTGALTSIDIRGKNDASLRERWSEGPSSYLGLAIADFPNLFTVTGPGSPSVLTNMLPTIEQHVEWITDCIADVRRQNCTIIEATAEAENAWWRHVQEVGQLGIKGSTNSWYVGANVEGKARVFMPYLGGFPSYCQKCDEVVANGYEGFALR